MGGRQRFRSLVRSAYRGARGILICFAVNNKQSLENVPLWEKELLQSAPEGTPP